MVFKVGRSQGALSLLFSLFVIPISTSYAIAQQPIGLPKHFEIYRLKQGTRKFHHLTKAGEIPSEENIKLTEKKVLAEIPCVENTIEKQIFQRYKKQYGVDRHDLIGMDQILDGILSLQTETEEELSFLRRALAKIEEACYREYDPDVDDRPADEGRINAGEYRPTIPAFQVPARLQSFRDEAMLAPNETVTWDQERMLLVYRLAKEHSDLLYEFVKPQANFLPIDYRRSVVNDMIGRFVEDTKFRPWERVKVATDGVYYLLTKNHREQLEEIVTQFDRPPYELVVEIQMLSVNREHSQQVNSFFHTLLSDGPQRSSDILPGIIDDVDKVARIKLQGANYLLDYTFKAMEKKGLGSRASKPEFKTTEYYDGLPKPKNLPLLKKKIVTPIQNILQNQVTQRDVEVGLGIEVHEIKVLETKDFLRKLQDLNFRIGNWTNNPRNRELLKRVEEAYRQERFAEVPLDEIEEINRIGRAFDMEYRTLLHQLQIKIDLTVEDGGVLRTVDNQQSINVIYDQFTYKSALTLDNRKTVFIGGTSQDRQGQETKSIPVLSDLPLIGWFFKDKKKTQTLDTVVAFLTVSIVDNVTDLQLAGKYGVGAMRQSIPVALGGYSVNGVEGNRLRTGLRSNLPWMYDPRAGEIYYVARNKLAAGWRFPQEMTAVLFAKRILLPLREEGLISDEDWLNFATLKERLDHTRGYRPGGGPAPVLSALESIRKDLMTISRCPEFPNGIVLTDAEILALVRHEGFIGRGAILDQPDDRLLEYLAYLSAKANPKERQVFKTDEEIKRFETVTLPSYVKAGCAGCKTK